MVLLPDSPAPEKEGQWLQKATYSTVPEWQQPQEQYDRRLTDVQ